MVLDERHGSFGQVIDVVIENNEVDEAFATLGKKGTRSTRSASIAPGDDGATVWFSDDLVFNTPIDPASIRCWLYGPHGV